MHCAQIIALGGANFSAPGSEPVMENYLLAQTGQAIPAVSFIPTASGDSDMYIARFFETFAPLSCRPSVLRLFRRTLDLRAYLFAQDLIFVGGGNTKSMLAVWREWGLPALLREAWLGGVVLAGSSAGAICWFEHGTTDSFDGQLRALPGLGFLPGTCCPHYDSEIDRRPTLRRMLSNRELPAAYALDDNAALHFVGRELHCSVATDKKSQAFSVAMHGSLVVETALPIMRLAAV